MIALAQRSMLRWDAALARHFVPKGAPAPFHPPAPRREVSSTEDVRSALNAAGEKPAVLLVVRGGQTIFVPLRGR